MLFEPMTVTNVSMFSMNVRIHISHYRFFLSDLIRKNDEFTFCVDSVFNRPALLIPLFRYKQVMSVSGSSTLVS